MNVLSFHPRLKEIRISPLYLCPKQDWVHLGHALQVFLQDALKDLQWGKLHNFSSTASSNDSSPLQLHGFS